MFLARGWVFLYYMCVIRKFYLALSLDDSFCHMFIMSCRIFWSLCLPESLSHSLSFCLCFLEACTLPISYSYSFFLCIIYCKKKKEKTATRNVALCKDKHVVQESQTCDLLSVCWYTCQPSEVVLQSKTTNQLWVTQE